MLASFERTLTEECAVQPGDRLLVGVSGGPDSLCLLDLLVRCGFAPCVAHFDHRLRPGSAEEAGLVRALAGRLGLPFLLGEADVAGLARAGSLSVEEAARLARYRFLFEQAGQVGAQAVAVAHNADDQVETVLMHLLRGAGLSGLRGMPARAMPNPWSESIPLIRPLLGFWRAEILEYCDWRGLQPVFDPSNQDPAYFRNRLRHELIPYLETYNPELRQVVRRMTRLLQGDFALIQAVVAQAWRDCARETGPGYVGFDLPAVADQPAAIQRYLVRRAAGWLRPGLRDIGYEAVERALAYLADAGRPAEIDWVAGLRLVTEADHLWLADRSSGLPPGDWPQLSSGVEIPIVPGEVLELGAGWELRAAAVDDLDQARRLSSRNRDPFQAWLALDEVEGQPVLRRRRPGDRLRPLGLPEGSIKVSDLMINLKLPRRARPGWPLVCLGHQVAWIPGCRLSHDFRLTPQTHRAIHLRLFRSGDRP